MPGELLLITLLLLSGADVQPAAVSSPPFIVVVNSDGPVTSLTRAQLSAIFMRRQRSWPDRNAIAAVDRPVRSRLREQFSRSVHGKSVAYVTRYWQRLIFSGRDIPPPVLDSDADVLNFVKAHRNAIGYVNADTLLGDGVKRVVVRP